MDGPMKSYDSEKFEININKPDNDKDWLVWALAIFFGIWAIAFVFHAIRLLLIFF
jgi:hypothetical protein